MAFTLEDVCARRFFFGLGLEVVDEANEICVEISMIVPGVLEVLHGVGGLAVVVERGRSAARNEEKEASASALTFWICPGSSRPTYPRL